MELPIIELIGWRLLLLDDGEIIELSVLRTIFSKGLDPEHTIMGFFDINGDGDSEFIVSTKYSVKCYNPLKGELLWSFEPMKGTIVNAIIRDIDLDKEDEILVLSKSDNGYVFYVISNMGDVLTEIDLGKQNVSLTAIRSIVTKNNKAILIPLKNKLTIYDMNGKLIWNFIAPSYQYFYYRLDDYDGDGVSELLLSYVFKEHVLIEIIDLDSLVTKWSLGLPIETSEKPFIEEKPLKKGTALFLYMGNQLTVIDGKNGKILYEHKIDAYEVFSGTADINGDGEKEIVICSMDENNYTSMLTVYYPTTRQSVKYVFDTAIVECKIKDYNGDGKEEVAFIGFNEIILVSDSGVSWKIDNIFESSIYNVVSEDFDNDGIPELLVIGEVGAAILDLRDREILWMDRNIIINEVEELLGVGDILPIDIDDDGNDEYLIIDEPNKRLIALKGEYGRIKELWTLIFRGNELKDIEILYPNTLIVIAIDDKLLAVNSNGELVWEKRNFPISYMLFGELNGDGKAEIITYYDKSGISVLESDTGSVLWVYPGRVKMIRVSDVNGDGKQEVLLARGDTMSILNGENGKVLFVRIMEGKISRFDTTDIDSDGVDEIIITSGNLIVLMKDYQQIWEYFHLDPKMVKGLETCKYEESTKLDVCLYTSNYLLIFDGLTGELKERQFYHKITDAPIIVDIDKDGLDEIIIRDREKKGILIIGKTEHKFIQTPSRRGTLKALKERGFDVLFYIADNKRVYLYNSEQNAFDLIFKTNDGEKIIDTNQQRGSLYILVGVKEQNVVPKITLYRYSPKLKLLEKVTEGLFLWGRQENQKQKILRKEEIKDILSKLVLVPNFKSIELIGVGRKGVYLYSKEFRSILYYDNEHLLKEITKIDSFVVSNFSISDRESQILGVLKDTFIIIDMGSGRMIRGKLSLENVVNVYAGDIDGDGKNEALIVSDKGELFVFDPFLYLYGCNNIYRIKADIKPLRMLLSDVNLDGKDEIITVIDRGLSLYALDIFDKILTQEYEEYQVKRDSKIKLKLVTLKAKELCGKGLINKETLKKILEYKDFEKVLIWKKSSRGSEQETTSSNQK